MEADLILSLLVLRFLANRVRVRLTNYFRHVLSHRNNLWLKFLFSFALIGNERLLRVGSGIGFFCSFTICLISHGFNWLFLLSCLWFDKEGAQFDGHAEQRAGRGGRGD